MNKNELGTGILEEVSGFVNFKDRRLRVKQPNDGGVGDGREDDLSLVEGEMDPEVLLIT